LDRTRRDPGPFRPHPGDVPRADRGRLRCRPRQRGRNRLGDGWRGPRRGRGVSDHIRNETVSEQMLRRNLARRFDFGELVILPILAVAIALLIGGVIMLLTGVRLPAIGAAY